ncbi:hypothetical protein [Streptomyces sp. NPDC017260]|uniref:hypothetical protein n=1 Tax=unclassified Streptomyces TaxID=2593676 RepID=UPI0037AD4606
MGHGKRGTIHQAYWHGMEDQLGSLGLVLNAGMLWATRCAGAAGLSSHRRRGLRHR